MRRLWDSLLTAIACRLLRLAPVDPKGSDDE